MLHTGRGRAARISCGCVRVTVPPRVDRVVRCHLSVDSVPRSLEQNSRVLIFFIGDEITESSSGSRHPEIPLFFKNRKINLEVLIFFEKNIHVRKDFSRPLGNRTVNLVTAM